MASALAPSTSSSYSTAVVPLLPSTKVTRVTRPLQTPIITNAFNRQLSAEEIPDCPELQAENSASESDEREVLREQRLSPPGTLTNAASQLDSPARIKHQNTLLRQQSQVALMKINYCFDHKERRDNLGNVPMNS
ncbi:UNVERIFIED_CONTAM: hypothetical protein FKN15_011956 [Acipenser sinensis]